MSGAASVWTWMLLIGFLLLIVYWKTGSFFKCILTSSLTGVSALGIIWLVGRFLEVPVTITPLSLTCSALLGAPGVITMLILNLI